MASKFGGVPVSKFGGVPVQPPQVQQPPAPQQPEYYGAPVVEQGRYQVGGDTPGAFTDRSLPNPLQIGSKINDLREALKSLLTGTFAGTVAPIGGAIAMAREDANALVTGEPANPLAGPQARDRIANTLTYEPKSEGGKRLLEGQAELLKPVANAVESARLGDEALDAGMSEEIARQAEMIPEYILSGLTAVGLRQPPTKPLVDKNLNLAGGVDKDAALLGQLKNKTGQGATAKWELNPNGEVVKSATGKAAINQGWDSVTVAGAKHATPSTKMQIRRMARVARDRLDDNATAKSKIETRPSDVPGERLAARYKFLREANTSSGKLLKKIASDYKGRVDIKKPVDWMKQQLAENGITVKENGTLDFTRAKLPAEDFKLISENWRQMNVMLSEGDTFATAHALKQMMRRNGLAYGKTLVNTGASQVTQNIYKGFSSKIDEILDNLSDAYNKQDIKFGKTRKAMDAVEKIAKDALINENPESALGTLTKRMMGNPTSRQAVINYTKELDEVVKEYGGNFDDDLFLQAYIANDMDKVIEIAAKTSLKGEAGIQAAAAAAEKSNIGKLAGAYDKVKSVVSGQNPESALDALQALTK